MNLTILNKCNPCTCLSHNHPSLPTPSMPYSCTWIPIQTSHPHPVLILVGASWVEKIEKLCSLISWWCWWKLAKWKYVRTLCHYLSPLSLPHCSQNPILRSPTIPLVSPDHPPSMSLNTMKECLSLMYTWVISPRRHYEI